MNYDICSWLMEIFRTRVVGGGAGICQSTACCSLRRGTPTSVRVCFLPLFLTPDLQSCLQCRFSLALPIPMSPQRIPSYWFKSTLDFPAFRTNLLLLLDCLLPFLGGRRNRFYSPPILTLRNLRWHGNHSNPYTLLHSFFLFPQFLPLA